VCRGWFAARISKLQVPSKRQSMNNIVYIVGLVVIVIAVLGFFGLR
jgi:hypothetical protein